MQRPSQTALTVLAGVWLTECDPDRRVFGDREIGEWSGRALSALNHPYAWALKFGLARKIAYRKESQTLPGICAHYAARKKAIQGLVDVMPISSLAVLGAGLDGLAARKSSQWRCIEVDQPETQSFKSAILEKLKANVTLIPGNLERPELEIPDTDATVLEGVSMYLSAESLTALLSRTRQRSKILIATFMELDSTGRPAFRGRTEEVDRFLAKVNEPFRFGGSRGQLEELLSSVGWKSSQYLDYQSVPGMIPGESIIVAH